MSYGKGYDSDEGRGLAGAITSLMTGTAYEVSAEIAAATGPFPGYRDCALRRRGEAARARQRRSPCSRSSSATSRPAPRSTRPRPPPSAPRRVKAWETRAGEAAREHGYRNAQVTVLAPTGTIGFLMDCDTTGIEPDIALVKYKLLAGGGMLKIVNQTVPGALKELGYSADAGRGDRRLHRQERHHRRRAAPQGRSTSPSSTARSVRPMASARSIIARTSR